MDGWKGSDLEEGKEKGERSRWSRARSERRTGDGNGGEEEVLVVQMLRYEVF